MANVIALTDVYLYLMASLALTDVYLYHTHIIGLITNG